MPRANLKIPGIDESQHFLNFEARFHKVGFVVLLCIISTGLIWFSGGFVSDTVSKNTTGTMTLHFERFGRWQTEFNMKISATDQHSGKNIYRIAGDFTTFMKLKIYGLNLTACTARRCSVPCIIQPKISRIHPSGYVSPP